ncbi:MAG TPA: hypothetical protein VH442_01735 [Micromonosporaceae bacterium]|jgi:hypothetical protein
MRGTRLPAVAAISFAAAAGAVFTPAVAAAAVTSATPDPVSRGGTAVFRVQCGPSVRSASLAGAALGLNRNVPMDATSAGHFMLTLRIPPTAAPGWHNVNMVCANGDTGTVRVKVAPRGGADIGPGSDAAFTTAVLGGGAAALAAVCGAIVIGRRQDLDTND